MRSPPSRESLPALPTNKSFPTKPEMRLSRLLPIRTSSNPEPMIFSRFCRVSVVPKPSKALPAAIVKFGSVSVGMRLVVTMVVWKVPPGFW